MTPEIVETRDSTDARCEATALLDEDRRRFLRRAGRLGLAGPAIAVLLTAGDKPAQADIIYTE